MAIKIKRCLYIGLGGTGMNAILRTKKKFIENYGEVPPMIGFLGIDTDGASYNKSLDGVRLVPSEQVSISGRDLNPREFIEANKENFDWLPEESYSMISELGDGAGQIRTNGRVALILNAQRIDNSIQGALDNIRNIKIAENKKYEIVNATQAKDEVHIVFSLSGGTGAGTFIDIAYLVRSVARNEVKIAGYAVLPEVFKSMVKSGVAMDNVRPNAYSSICDIDYLMDLPGEGKGIILDYISRMYETKRRPFDAIYVVNNKNALNVNFDHLDDICEMISLVLITSSGSISGALTSTLDNVESMMRQKVLNVGNKLAWVSSIGACEITFKSQDIKRIYTYKAAQRIIELLLNSCGDTNKYANEWIDSKDVDIRENNGSQNDKVIDRFGKPINFIDPAKRPGFEEIQSEDNIPNIISTYLNDIMPDPTKQKEILENLCENIKVQLEKRVNELLNRGDCGIATAIGFLGMLLSQINLFLEEMNEELILFTEKIQKDESNKKVSQQDLAEEFHHFRLFSSKKKDYFEDLMDSCDELAKDTIEKDRRNYAIQFFNSLKGDISTLELKLSQLKNTVKAVYSSLTNELSAIQNQYNRANPITEINLAEGMLNNVFVKDDDLLMNEFVNAMPKNNLFNLGNAEICLSIILDYTNKLSSARSYNNLNVDTIINGMDQERFTRLMEEVDLKATPLLRIDGKGRKTNNGRPLVQAINKYYYVGVPDEKSSRFYKDNAFQAQIGGAEKKISFISTGMKDRIVIYRQEGCLPAFSIDGIDLWKNEFERRSNEIFYDIDKNMVKRMIDENYSLLPIDPSIEKRSLEYWVKGLIYGFIRRNENKEFEYINKGKGMAILDYWVNTYTTDRCSAFNLFRGNLSFVLADYDKLEQDMTDKKTSEEKKAFVDDIRKNYMEKYSLNDKDIKDLIEDKRYAALVDLLNSEKEYVENEI